MVNIPSVTWAQRSDKLYITIDVQDVKDQSVDLEASKLSFKGKAGSDPKDYALGGTSWPIAPLGPCRVARQAHVCAVGHLRGKHTGRATS
jgi:hypothetical protein